MNKLRIFIQCFLAVTTGIVIIGVFVYPSAPEALSPNIFWQILLSAGLCAGATAIFFPDENAGTIRIWVGIGLHFLSLCVIMVCCGRWFGWVGDSLWSAAAMVGYVVLVYAFTTITTYLLEKKRADTLNQKLQEKYHTNWEDASGGE